LFVKFFIKVLFYILLSILPVSTLSMVVECLQYRFQVQKFMGLKPSILLLTKTIPYMMLGIRSKSRNCFYKPSPMFYGII